MGFSDDGAASDVLRVALDPDTGVPASVVELAPPGGFADASVVVPLAVDGFGEEFLALPSPAAGAFSVLCAGAW
jgi:hypothetical protein